ncbi:hypothetical protein G6F57_014308 [Rhizopus arrhizus]|nr:hypothetical protein G6F57_014308 [Rhizopus arrhizus]
MRAISLVGTPYRYGGNTPDSGFDCSGLVAYVYREMLDLKLPRTSRDLAAVQGPKIDPQRLATGDLVFFGSRGNVTHVGIYVGEGRFVHAPSTGGTVRLDSLSGPYWKDHYTGAKRQTSVSSRSARPLLLGLALCLTSLPAWSQTAPNRSDVTPAPVAESPARPAAKAEAAAPQRSRVDAAASATLAALLPHLAANDTIPLMDRSAVVAGDLSRLLANYDTSSAANGSVVGTAADNGKVQSLLRRAMTLLGTPYRWGGSNPDSGFDCSGLVGYVFRSALGIELPRVSREMAHDDNAELINDRTALAAGDLVFFGRKGRVDHVGIYVGDGRFLHAPSSGKDVRVDTLLSGYWGNKFMQARRVDL